MAKDSLKEACSVMQDRTGNTSYVLGMLLGRDLGSVFKSGGLKVGSQEDMMNFVSFAGAFLHLLI